MEDFQALFDKFKSIKVGIIGDVMLDTYMWGSVNRISPEAPVPIVSLSKKDYRVGGAGNVALNLQSLGAKAFVLSVTGEDEDADKLNGLFTDHNIPAQYLFKSIRRITTNKTRIISRNQHMMRLDAEVTDDLQAEDEQRLIELFQDFLVKENPDIVIFQDYNKGILTKSVIANILSQCKKSRVLTAVDPKRKNFFEYREVNLFKPNLKEVKEAFNLLFTNIQLPQLQNIHAELHRRLHHQVSLITLSDKGVFYQQENKSSVIPSHLRNIADVSGAGDTVIAVGALVYAATGNVHLMAEVANIAGGLVCEEVGTAAVDKQKLLHECELLLC